MQWYHVVARIVLLMAAAVAIGWYYGRPMVAALAMLSAIVIYWVFQQWRVQKWLDDPSQSPPDVQGIWGDILARIYRHQRLERETQAKLQSTADFFRASFASMRDGVVIINERGNISWANQAAGKLTGLRYPDDQDQPLSNLIRVPELQQYLLGADYSSPLQYCADPEAGVYLLLEVSRFGEGDRLLFFRDVTALVQIDHMRRDFIGNISHELRTPLTVITGYLGAFLGENGKLPEPYRKPVTAMVQQAERMETLLKDLLWLSRIESEEREEKREILDIRALLQELHEELQDAHPRREIRLLLETDQPIMGDYRELHSAVSNLASNALKYSKAGSPVEISWRECGTNYELCVRDQGQGIEEQHLPRLTERFYRVDDSRSAATGGTGLGLAIVKHVAVSHGAELKIDSRPGEGSAFTLVFPRSCTDLASSNSRPAEPRTAPTGT
jgi:two-component system phosphate regulon sensor histidine kinase PhoR